MIYKSILNLFSDFLLQPLIEKPFFRKTAKFLNLHFSPKNDVLVRINNHKMYANTLDRIIALYLWKFFGMEEFETKIMKEIIKKGMVVFDIGANIGYYSLILAGMVGQNGRVYSFEPEPTNYQLLLKNIKENRYKNIITIQKAVSDKVGKINLYISEEHRGDHRIYDSGGGRKSIIVETITLDKFVRQEIKPDIIKMDLQGAEFLALLGMDKLIRRNKDLIIICEFTPSLLRKCGTSPRSFINKLKKYGFKIKFINEKKCTIESIDYHHLMKICKGNKYANLFLKR